MLHLAGGVGLGVQVADLLHLKGALVAGGGPHAPADEQGACRVHHGVGRRFHRRIAVGEDALDLLGGIGQLAEQQLDLPAGQPAHRLTEQHRQKREETTCPKKLFVEATAISLLALV